jgi:hypothetical protein
MAIDTTMRSTATGGPAAPKKNIVLMVVLIVIGVFIALGIGIFALVFSIGSPALKASDTFVMQLSGNQVDSAYDSTSSLFKKTVSKDQFNGFLEQYPVLKNIKTTSFTSFSIVNDQATVSGTMKTGDGLGSPITLNLVNEDGTWKVLSMDLNPPAQSTTIEE